MLNQTDEQLVLCAKKGNDQALESLVLRYFKLVYNFSFRYVVNEFEAEDITQEVFIKIWKKLKSFDETRSFKPWLFEITKNTCLDFLKKKSALAFSFFETENGNTITDTLADSSLSVETQVGKKILIEKAEQAIKALSPKAMETVFLYHREQLNFREISTKLKTPLHTIKSRYRRALLQLKQTLGSSK